MITHRSRVLGDNEMSEFNYSWSKPEKHIRIKHYVYPPGAYHYNWHKEIEIMLILRGNVEVTYQGHLFDLGEDDIILMDAGIGHASLSKTPDSLAMVVRFDPIFFREFLKGEVKFSFLFSEREAYSERQYHTAKKLREVLSELATQWSEQDTPLGQIILEKSVYSLAEFLMEFCFVRNNSIVDGKYDSDEKVKGETSDKAAIKLCDYIENNYSKKITLEQLGKISSYHPTYVSQLFVKCLGITFQEFVTRVRLREATIHLTQTDMRIAEIALNCGFPDVKSFNMAFKKTFNQLPSAYRKAIPPEIKLMDVKFKQNFVQPNMPYLVDKLNSYRMESNDCKKLFFQGLYRGNHIADAETLMAIAEKLKNI